MLTLSQSLKSKTVWSAIIAAAPEVWNLISSDPVLKIPDNIVHLVGLAGMVSAIIFRVVNTQGRNNA